MRKDKKPIEIKDPNKKSVVEMFIVVVALGYYFLEGYKIVDFITQREWGAFYMMGFLTLLAFAGVGIQKIREGIT